MKTTALFLCILISHHQPLSHRCIVGVRGAKPTLQERGEEQLAQAAEKVGGDGRVPAGGRQLRQRASKHHQCSASEQPRTGSAPKPVTCIIISMNTVVYSPCCVCVWCQTLCPGRGGQCSVGLSKPATSTGRTATSRGSSAATTTCLHPTREKGRACSSIHRVCPFG